MVPVKKKKGKIYVPPREQRGILKFKKQFPFTITLKEHLVASGFFVKQEIKNWLNKHLPNHSYMFSEEGVIFAFKTEDDLNKFKVLYDNLA